MDHQHNYSFSTYCGAHVCLTCNQHAHLRSDGTVSQTLARCYCGWSASGGDGRQELREYGETVEEEDY